MNIDELKKLGACEEALEWAKQQESYEQAWQDCERGDWLAWLIGKLSGKPGSDGPSGCAYALLSAYGCRCRTPVMACR